MITRSLELRHTILPAPRLAATAWLLSPLRSVGPETRAELRQSLMRRLPAVLVSAVLSVFVAAIAAFTHPDPALIGWFVLEVALSVIRIPLVVALIRFSPRAGHPMTVDARVVDLFVALGTLWSALVGVGALVCLRTGDPGLSILVSLQAMGTIGAQGVRSPGTPRLNTLQMCLIMGPLLVGVMTTSIPLVDWSALLIPPYLFGMISITQQLHDDFVRLIEGRIESRKRALHCPLTGLPNRAYFDEVLATALTVAEARGRPLTVMYLDLDGFKRVNDERGHAVGDVLLGQVADRLRSWKRPETIVARLGGDEFTILLRSLDARETEAEALALIQALSRPYDLGGDGFVTVGLSVGIATSAVAGDGPQVLMRADHALYAAKRAGKGTFRSYDAPGDPAVENAGAKGIAQRMRAMGAPVAEAV